MTQDEEDDEEFDFEIRNGTNALLINNYPDTYDDTIRPIFDWDDDEDIYRIGIAGSFATGKTEFAKRLAVKLEVPYIENIAITAYCSGLNINKKVNIESQLAIWLAQFYEQLTVEQFVSDSSLLTSLAYLEYYAIRHGNIPTITALRNVTGEIINQDYSCIFYLPVTNDKIRGNGKRSVDKKFQREIDTIILNLLTAYEVEYIPLVGKLPERMATVEAYFSNL